MSALSNVGFSAVQPYANSVPQPIDRIIYPDDQQALISSPSLEKRFSALAFPEESELEAECHFRDCLSPNEGNPQNVRPLLESLRPGFLVSTGTERSFFDLLFCDSDKCHGLIVRDINPRVKKYVDFNVLLLRIAEDCEDYRFLSTCEYQNPEKLAEKIEEIHQRIQRSQMSSVQKEYYLKHLDSFALVYYRASLSWRSSYQRAYYSEVQYQEDPKLFNKLQMYAREGNIVATIGDINDLKQFDKIPLSVVDVSNIPDYILIDMKSSQNFPIIWTNQDPRCTKYFRAEISHLSLEERKVFDKLLKHIKDAGVSDFSGGREAMFLRSLVSFVMAPVGFNREWLNELQNKIKPHLVKIPRIGYLFFSIFHEADIARKLNNCPKDALDQVWRSPELLKYLPCFVRGWSSLSPSVYAALSRMDGWQECFQEVYESNKDNSSFIKRFEKDEELRSLLERARALSLDQSSATPIQEEYESEEENSSFIERFEKDEELRPLPERARALSLALSSATSIKQLFFCTIV